MVRGVVLPASASEVDDDPGGIPASRDPLQHKVDSPFTYSSYLVLSVLLQPCHNFLGGRRGHRHEQSGHLVRIHHGVNGFMIASSRFLQLLARHGVRHDVVHDRLRADRPLGENNYEGLLQVKSIKIALLNVLRFHSISTRKAWRWCASSRARTLSHCSPSTSGSRRGRRRSSTDGKRRRTKRKFITCIRQDT